MASALKKTILSATAITLVGASIWSVNDYNEWTALGEGGIAHGPIGWATVTAIRLLKINPIDTQNFSSDIGKPWDIGTLGDLPAREGDRPRIAPHPVPHRQLSQPGKPGLSEIQQASLQARASADPSLTFKLSHTEAHTDALWVANNENANPAAKNNGEIAHVHPSDGSLHVILSPSDAKTVIERKWGELHPLSGVGGILPSNTYVLLYAPRNEMELALHEKIIEAAIAYTLHQSSASENWSAVIQTNKRG